MIEILFSDAQLLVCRKPVGILSQGDGTVESMETLLRAQCGGEIYPIHRLDQNVGGVMVYARTARAAAELSRQVQEKRMVKEYLAVVEQQPPEAATWEDLLWKDARAGKTYVVKRMRKGVRDAKLSYRRLQSADWEGKTVSLCEIRLETGRSHQIRAQFSSRGYPLVGDGKYGSRIKTALRLHSYRISFAHPISKQPMQFCIPMPQDFL